MNGDGSKNKNSGKKEHLKWLESMKLKHKTNLTEINGNRMDKLKREIVKKANLAIQAPICEECYNMPEAINVPPQSEENLLRKKERQRIFAKYIDMKTSFPKTTLERNLEEKMHEAIQNNNLYQMESINKQLMDIHLNQVLKVADRKTRFELKIKKNKDRHKPMLNWKFTKKERWERKSNS